MSKLEDDLDDFNININSLLEKYPQLDEFVVQAALLSSVVKRILKRRANVQLSTKPAYKLKNIAEFMKRMRISSIEKFNMATYISSINFFKSEKDMKENNILGTLLIYVGEDYVPTLLKRLQYLDSNDDLDDGEFEDGVGTLCNLIAGKFKEGLIQIGYSELIMSHFISYQNVALDGVEFNNKEKQVYEISYEIDKEVQIIAELCMGNVPRSKY